MIITPLLREIAEQTGELYVVGGTVRNFITGLRGNSDVDIAGRILPCELKERLDGSRFFVAQINERLGTVVIGCHGGGEKFEYTAFRREKYEGGKHSPSEVEFTRDIEEDALRRDFTVNAVYYDILKGKLIDPTGKGVSDAKAGILRAVTDPEIVFSVDGLRIMRLARFAAQLGFAVEDGTLAAAKRMSALLKDISAERMAEELRLILRADEKYDIPFAQYRGLKILYETGALSYIIPELLEGDGVAQRADFHRFDVLEHGFMSVKYACSDVRLAALLHDVAKPKRLRETGKMFGHDEEGERMTRVILRRLKFSNAEIEETARLVGLHMQDLDCKTSEKKVRVKIAENLPLFEKLMRLKQADYLGCGILTDECPTVKKWRAIRADMERKGLPLSVKELDVSAGELTAKLDLKGAEIGGTLKELLRVCLIRGERLTREQLLREAEILKRR